MKMYVLFYYGKIGRIKVEAINIKKAQKKARAILDEMSRKDYGGLECVDDFAVIDYEGLVFGEDQNIIED